MTARRILFIGQTGALGGAEFVLLDIARHYRDRCHVLLLSDGPFRRRLEALGVPVSVLPAGERLLGVRRGGRLGAVLRAVPSVIGSVRAVARFARDYDVLYPNSQKAAVVAMLAGRMIGKPVVWHLHDILSPTHFAGLQRRAVVRLANHAATRVVANSAASREAFVASGGKPSLIAVVPNGIDVEAFEDAPSRSAEAIARLARAGRGRLIGLFGRVAPWKGQHVLIEAMPRMPGVHALIVGDAMFGEDAYKQQVIARARALGVSDRVHWIGFREDVPALMRAVDVVVHASTAPEPFGRVLVEAMLARRPIVAARDGAVPEVLGEDYEFLVEPGDEAALADAITRCLGTAAGRIATITDSSRDRAVKLFSVQSMVAGIDRELSLAA